MPALRLALVSIVLAGICRAGGDQVLRTPSMPDWKLIHKVDPEYPAAALRNRIHGDVRFECLIGRDGRVERLRLIGGHPLLVRAARDAARQWIYEPSFVGNKPVRVITVIDVQFQLPARSGTQAQTANLETISVFNSSDS